MFVCVCFFSNSLRYISFFILISNHRMVPEKENKQTNKQKESDHIMERWQWVTQPLTVKYNAYVECKQGPVVRKPITAKLGLKFNQGSCFSYWKEFSDSIFQVAVRKHPKSKCGAKIIYRSPYRLNVILNLKLTLILGYLNPALNNRAQLFILVSISLSTIAYCFFFLPNAAIAVSASCLSDVITIPNKKTYMNYGSNMICMRWPSHRKYQSRQLQR